MGHVDRMDRSAIELSRVPNWNIILKSVVVSGSPYHANMRWLIDLLPSFPTATCDTSAYAKIDAYTSHTSEPSHHPAANYPPQATPSPSTIHLLLLLLTSPSPSDKPTHPSITTITTGPTGPTSLTTKTTTKPISRRRRSRSRRSSGQGVQRRRIRIRPTENIPT